MIHINKGRKQPMEWETNIYTLFSQISSQHPNYSIATKKNPILKFKCKEPEYTFFPNKTHKWSTGT